MSGFRANHFRCIASIPLGAAWHDNNRAVRILAQIVGIDQGFRPPWAFGISLWGLPSSWFRHPFGSIDSNQRLTEDLGWIMIADRVGLARLTAEAESRTIECLDHIQSLPTSVDTIRGFMMRTERRKKARHLGLTGS